MFDKQHFKFDFFFFRFALHMGEQRNSIQGFV